MDSYLRNAFKGVKLRQYSAAIRDNFITIEDLRSKNPGKMRSRLADAGVSPIDASRILALVNGSGPTRAGGNGLRVGRTHLSRDRRNSTENVVSDYPPNGDFDYFRGERRNSAYETVPETNDFDYFHGVRSTHESRGDFQRRPQTDDYFKGRRTPLNGSYQYEMQNTARTPLHVAAANGDAREVEVLLRSSNNMEDVIARDEDGKTPILYAMSLPEFREKRHCARVAKLLLDAQQRCRHDDIARRERELMEVLEKESDTELRAELQEHILSPHNFELCDAYDYTTSNYELFADGDDEAKEEMRTYIISFSDLSEIKQIGAGSTSITYKAKYKHSKNGATVVEDVVCKVAKADMVGASASEWTELSNLAKAPQHPNVMRLVGMCAEWRGARKIVLVFKFYSGGSLDTLNKDPRYQSDPLWFIKMAITMAQGVRHMHAHNILHRDIALRNFVRESADSDRAVLVDFGLSRLAWQHRSLLRGLVKSPLMPETSDAPREFASQKYFERFMAQVFDSLFEIRHDNTVVDSGYFRRLDQDRRHTFTVVPKKDSERLHDTLEYPGTFDHVMPWRESAPETLSYFSTSTRTEVYTLGITFWQFYNWLSKPFQEYPNFAHLKRAMNRCGTAHAPLDFSYVPSHIVPLIKAMVAINPEERPSLEEVERRLKDLREQIASGGAGDVAREMERLRKRQDEDGNEQKQDEVRRRERANGANANGAGANANANGGGKRNGYSNMRRDEVEPGVDPEYTNIRRDEVEPGVDPEYTNIRRDEVEPDVGTVERRHRSRADNGYTNIRRDQIGRSDNEYTDIRRDNIRRPSGDYTDIRRDEIRRSRNDYINFRPEDIDPDYVPICGHAERQRGRRWWPRAERTDGDNDRTLMELACHALE